MDKIIHIEFTNVEEAAEALRTLKGKINSRTIECGLAGTQGSAREQIDALVSVLKETQQNILELVTNSQAALVYLSEAFRDADSEASATIEKIG